MKFIEELMLPFVGLKVFILQLFWEKAIKKKYYGRPRFAGIDQAFLQSYLHVNPYRICRCFMEKRGAHRVHVYGETPLVVYDKMAFLWGLKPCDIFLELGCGRGRGLFFLSEIYRCHCIGIEWVEEFVDRTEKLIHTQGVTGVEVYHGDFLQKIPLQADFIYLYGCMLEDEEIVALCGLLKDQPSIAKIVTVSFALQEYDPEFRVQDNFKTRFPWGETEVFLNKRR
ncbi:MAG: class I SAM-dependent methyltransferase [Chlamydiae bacterium]|nr:class I SAM-dependent methyltransferase [Chlamydiota bacterium]